VGLGRETCHTADCPDDLGGQDGSYAEDLGEGGAGSFHLGFDTLIEVRDLSLQCPDSKRRISKANRRRTRAEESCGRMPRRMRAARWVESVPATPPGTRSRRNPWRLP
jgi:hypothetical protein